VSAPVPFWAATPFVLLLLAIAIGPLAFRKAWHRHYPKVSFALGGLVVGYYLLARDGGDKVLHVGVEYLAFVALIGSLFVVASGVLIHVRARGSTAMNVAILGLGSLLSNLIGTTGAAMLLIRPYLRMNRGHLGAHHVPFFIFTVANVGGALTPIGDPPLFLGYLRGVPFFWTLQAAILPWLVTVAAILVLFVFVEAIQRGPVRARSEPGERMQIEIAGMRSFAFLFGILGLVLVQSQPFLREREPWSTLAVAAGMLVLGAAAYRSAEPRIHRENEFRFEPIREVAILFAGIFATMIPALEYLEQNARSLGLESPLGFYFATGALSSFLDNAPTYLTLLTAALGLEGRSVDRPEDVLAVLETSRGSLLVAAISCGAVFFGAMTYIGNGPNFMVKSIAEASGARCPSFLGYLIGWAVPVLLPVLVLVGLLFFHG
jgi:Na+/H+ antiporter NhaD/arsenite permease-like protein